MKMICSVCDEYGDSELCEVCQDCAMALRARVAELEKENRKLGGEAQDFYDRYQVASRKSVRLRGLLGECGSALVECLDCIAGCRMREETGMGGVQHGHDVFEKYVEDLARRVRRARERASEPA